MEVKATAETIKILSPWLQAGFAGFAFLLLGIIVWMIHMLLKTFQENTKALSANAEALSKNNDLYKEIKQVLIDIKDNLLERPCIGTSVNAMKFQLKEKD